MACLNWLGNNFIQCICPDHESCFNYYETLVEKIKVSTLSKLNLLLAWLVEKLRPYYELERKNF